LILLKTGIETTLAAFSLIFVSSKSQRMMNKSLIVAFISASISTAFGQEVWTNKSRILPDDLRKIPVAISIVHSPNPNYPELTTKGDKSKYKYVWKHASSVVSLNEDLEVIEAGSFIWYSAEGWKKNVEYDRKAFAKRFDCPKGILKKGEAFTFGDNYRFGNNLYGGDALWYIISKDKNGKIYKGFALLETEAELLSK
jgi:hypothetical protein